MNFDHEVHRLTVTTLKDNNPVSKEVSANFVDLTGDEVINNYSLTKKNNEILLLKFLYSTYEVPWNDIHWK